MEIKCLFGNLVDLGWSNDHKHYSVRRFNDGNGCCSSLGIEVLEGAHQNSQVQGISKAKWACEAAQSCDLEIRRNLQ